MTTFAQNRARGASGKPRMTTLTSGEPPGAQNDHFDVREASGKSQNDHFEAQGGLREAQNDHLEAQGSSREAQKRRLPACETVPRSRST